MVQSEAMIEDLKQQLDTALSAEDLLEELTERNLTLVEQVEEMKTTIEDLEALRELNDELEANHLVQERELREEVEFKDSLIREQARRIQSAEETNLDYESTIMRFRELVLSLQRLKTLSRISQQRYRGSPARKAGLRRRSSKFKFALTRDDGLEFEASGYQYEIFGEGYRFRITKRTHR